jgi:Xaa-Pro aminopeptidase
VAVTTGPAIAADSPSPFAARRDAFLSKMPADAIAVLHTAVSAELEVEDAYRQDSDFWYLTGLAEPDAIAVLRPKAPDGKRYVLFVRPRDFSREQWTGWRTGVEGATAEHGADEAHPISELAERLPQLLKGARGMLVSDGHDAKFREEVLAAWSAADLNGTTLRPVGEAGAILHDMRLVKDAAELERLRKAGSLSAEAHRAALAVVAPGRNEYALKGTMVGVCLSGGAARMAYPPIVGSGRNSVVLHYERDNKQMEPGEMVVNDTACEYDMYASDLTRSYPVSGRFSPEQRSIYEVVLAAQKAGFAKVRPGTPFRDVHQTVVEAVVDGLLKLGLLSGEREEIIKSRSYRKLFPHGCCHWVGLNVHDVGSYGYPEGVDRSDRYGTAMAPLAAGEVLTVEPGIYVPEDPAIDKRYWNIGVRIEDTVLVTPTGMECLTCAAPRELADVEKALAAPRR